MTVAGILAYSLASSVVLALAVPALWTMVRRGRSARLGRIAVLVAVVVSMLAPLAMKSLPVYDYVCVELPNSVADLQSTGNVYLSENADASGSPLGYWAVAITAIIYVLGAIIMTAYIATGYIRLAVMIAKAQRTRLYGLTLCRHESVRSPFSWGRYVFVSEADIESSSSELEAILTHEKAHIMHRHWIDVALLDMVSVMQWYNPAAWAIRRLCRLNHELQADAAVVDQGTDSIDYQRLVVSRALESCPRMPAAGIGSDINDFKVRMVALQQGSRSGIAILMTAVMTAGMAVGIGTLSMPSVDGFFSDMSQVRFQDIASSAKAIDGNVNNYWFEGSSSGKHSVSVRMDEFPAYIGGRPGVEMALRQAIYDCKGDNLAGCRGVIKIVTDVDANGCATAIRFIKGIEPQLDKAILKAMEQYTTYSHPCDGKSRLVNICVTLR